jgi:hypothetical protein
MKPNKPAAIFWPFLLWLNGHGLAMWRYLKIVSP